MLNHDELDSSEKKYIGDIYKKYETVLFKCSMEILKNKTMAEDALHNTFVAIMEHKNTLRRVQEEKVLKWCVVILKNKCLDQLRRQNHLSAVPIDEIDFVVGTDGANLESKVIRDEASGILRKHIESLDIISRQILDMKYVLGMSYAEIAQELGVSTKYVDNKLMAAKARIRILFESEANLRNESK